RRAVLDIGEVQDNVVLIAAAQVFEVFMSSKLALYKLL
ncbi:hypothetical protein PSYMP_28678, partial [Pseudomonas amygdali pv. morsprunorum str. M302280]